MTCPCKESNAAKRVKFFSHYIEECMHVQESLVYSIYVLYSHRRHFTNRPFVRPAKSVKRAEIHTGCMARSWKGHWNVMEWEKRRGLVLQTNEEKTHILLHNCLKACYHHKVMPNSIEIILFVIASCCFWHFIGILLSMRSALFSMDIQNFIIFAWFLMEPAVCMIWFLYLLLLWLRSAHRP